MVSSPGLFENIPPRPPTPPRDTDRAVADALDFLSDSFETEQASVPTPLRLDAAPVVNTPPRRSPCSSVDQTASRSKGRSKKVDFSPWTDYHKADDYFARRKSHNAAAAAASPLRPLPQPRDPKTLKSILKPHEPPLTYDSDSASQSPHKYGNFAEMLEAMVKQLAGGSRPHKLDSYVTLLSTLKAYEDKPDMNALINKIGLLTQFIRRDIAIVNENTERQDCQLAVQALKLLIALMRLPAVADKIPEDFQTFFLDRSIEQFSDHTAPKIWVNPLIFAFSQQRFGPRAMTADRANRAITALQDIEDRISGSHVIIHRLLVYQKLLDQARPVMVARISDWLQHLFHPMLSSVKETRLRSIEVGTVAGVTIGDVPQVSRATVDIMGKEVEKGGTYGEYFAGRLSKMCVDDDAAPHVPNIWSAVMLLMRSRRKKIDQWRLLKKWLEVFQKCVNSGNKEVAAQANIAWNRFVYAMKPDESTTQPVRNLLRQAILSQIERRGTDKDARRMRLSAFSSYCNLLYYSLPPSASPEHLDLYWKEFVTVPLSKIAQIDQKGATTACRVLAALFKGNKSRIWNENLAIESFTIGTNDLPSIDPRWTRQRLKSVLQVVEICLANGSWDRKEPVSPSPSPTDWVSSGVSTHVMWTALMLAVAEAGSKEVTISVELKEAIAHIMNMLHRIWTNRPLSLGGDGGDQGSWIDKFGFLVTTTFETLGPAPFSDAILSRNAGSDFEAILTPSHRSKVRGALQSPLLFLLGLGSTSTDLDDLKLGILARQIIQLCCNAKPSRKLKLELLKDCVQSMTEESRPELQSGMWCLAADIVASTMQPSADVDASQQSGEEYRYVTKVLTDGLRYDDDHSLTIIRVLYESLVSTVREEGGDGAVALAVTEPLAEVLRSPVARHSQLASVHLSALALTGFDHPRHRKVIEQARKTLWGVSSGPQKPTDFDPYNHLYEMIVLQLRNTYEVLVPETRCIGSTVALLSTFCALLQHWPMSFASIMLRKTQVGIALWVADDEQKLGEASDALQGARQAVVNLWNIVATAIEGLPRKDSNVLRHLEVLVASGLSSRRKSILNRAIEMWNATFGKESNLQYPSKVEKALRRLRSIVDLQLPSFPDAADGDDTETLPAFTFTESQDDIPSSTSRYLPPLSHRPPPGAQRPPPSSSPPPPLGPSALAPSTRVGNSDKPTPRARLRHDDSQIQFVPIESSPAPEAPDSQMLTERQKEVRDRQKEGVAAMFPDISSSPIRQPKDQHLDLPMYHKPGDTPSLSDAESRSATPLVREQDLAAPNEVPNSSPTPKSRRSSQSSGNIAAFAPTAAQPTIAKAAVEPDIPSSPPRFDDEVQSGAVDSTVIEDSFVGEKSGNPEKSDKPEEMLDELLVEQLVNNASHLSESHLDDADNDSLPISDFSSIPSIASEDVDAANQLANEFQASAGRNIANQPDQLPDDTTIAEEQTGEIQHGADPAEQQASPRVDEEISSFMDVAENLPQGTAPTPQETAPAKIVIEEDDISETRLESSQANMTVDHSLGESQIFEKEATPSLSTTNVEGFIVPTQKDGESSSLVEKGSASQSASQKPSLVPQPKSPAMPKSLKRKNTTPVSSSKASKRTKRQPDPHEESDSSTHSDDSILSCIVVATTSQEKPRTAFRYTRPSTSQEQPEMETPVPPKKRAPAKEPTSGSSSQRSSRRISGTVPELNQGLQPRKRKTRSSQSTEADNSMHEDTVIAETPAPKKRRGRKPKASSSQNSADASQASQASGVRVFSHVEVLSSSGSPISSHRPSMERGHDGEGLTAVDAYQDGEVKAENEEEDKGSRAEAEAEGEAQTQGVEQDVQDWPRLQPRSILSKLKQILADCKQLVLRREEEREFDEALFEVRREIHEAGRRGREEIPDISTAPHTISDSPTRHHPPADTMVDRPHKPQPLPNTAKAASDAPQPVVDISSDNSRVTARLPTGESVEVLLYGATVISWKNADGSENLWLSEKAALDGSKPVRGGIPVVFPVFGPPPADHATSALPQHGFARNSRWEFLGKSTSESGSSKTASDDCVKLDFGLYSASLAPEARKAWPSDFGLVYSVTLGRDGLQTVMNVRNEGQEAFEFQVLLHSYLRVEDITRASVTGLLGVSYTDKVLNASMHTQGDANLTITGETDRVYAAIPQSTTTVLAGDKPRFDVVRDNLPDTVVWNPWKEKAAAMGDFAPDDGYKHMLCVEAGSVKGWATLEAGDTWEGGQTIKSLL
ncbi:uncharacterized protein K452DRAFT_362669 [Aplosporella prunicola CBS 121167]|uniref:glucose-6-phosphate 1-epimerase n=1 Tax=Aplosporella prunicola CBS 121167 TaxID=1176127 RepID=A0A6A6AZ04_9PEZI|nr:uncharacterized protein K452DRAFT_362669 [Aplosporella prunicola CBS 121167]KAF2136234.1 hypothetical protein K452DRAFT_362669 [Aplosporella prunicola CBS 121167]